MNKSGRLSLRATNNIQEESITQACIFYGTSITSNSFDVPWKTFNFAWSEMRLVNFSQGHLAARGPYGLLLKLRLLPRPLGLPAATTATFLSVGCTSPLHISCRKKIAGCNTAWSAAKRPKKFHGWKRRKIKSGDSNQEATPSSSKRSDGRLAQM